MSRWERIREPNDTQTCVLATACSLQAAAWLLLSMSRTTPGVATAIELLAALAWACTLSCAAYAVPLMYMEPKAAWRATITAHAALMAGAWVAALITS